MNARSRSPISAVHSSASRATASNASSDQPTRSSLLTHTTTWRRPSSAQIARWRRLWRVSPPRTSTSTTAASAVEAPVSMLRVYCAWPGQSISTKRRRVGGERAVRDVDRDALLALGAQAVGELREVVRALVGEQRAGVVQQPPDQGRLAVVDGAGGGDAAGGPSEVALALAVLHRGLADAVVGARLPALGHVGRGDLGHDLLQRRRLRAHGAGDDHVARPCGSGRSSRNGASPFSDTHGETA